MKLNKKEIGDKINKNLSQFLDKPLKVNWSKPKIEDLKILLAVLESFSEIEKSIDKNKDTSFEDMINKSIQEKIAKFKNIYEVKKRAIKAKVISKLDELLEL